MPNINFDASDSLYKFKCLLGMSCIVGPHIFIYFFFDEDGKFLYSKIFHINNKETEYIIIIIIILFSVVGLYLMIIGFVDWKKHQTFVDKKLEIEIKELEIASLKEIENKNKTKYFEEIENKNNNKSKYIDINSIYNKRIENEFERKLNNFSLYLQKTKGNEYNIYNNAKIDNRYRMEGPLICDCIAESKDNKKQDIIYEVKFSTANIEIAKRTLLKMLEVYNKKFNRKCRGEIAVIQTNENSKKINKELCDYKMNINGREICIKVYDYNKTIIK